MTCLEHRRRQRGAAAVELALVLIPLLVIVLGAIDWGYYFYVRQMATNAAREGARAAAAAAVARNDGPTVASTYMGTQLGSGTTVATGNCTNPAPPACAGTSCACVQVTCTIGTRGSVTRFLPAGLIPASIVSQATMRYE
jgi:Flp pilus assembly protein TadG